MRVWQAWTRTIATRESPTSLALMRITFGLLVAVHVTHEWVSGAADWVWVNSHYGGLRDIDGGWLVPLGGATPQNTHAVMAAAIGGGLAMAIGLFTPVSTLVTFLAWRVLADLNSHAGGSSDELVTIALWLILISGAGNALSVDAKLFRRRQDVLAFPRWLAVLQVAVMYTSTASQKVSESWVPGGPSDALWYILQQPTWQRIPMTWA